MGDIDEKFLEFFNSFEDHADNPFGFNLDQHLDFIMMDVRLRKAAEIYKVYYPDESPRGTKEQQMQVVSERFLEHGQNIKTQILSNRFAADIALEFEDTNDEFSEAISFDENQKTAIDEIIVQLRQEIKKADWLTDEHQQRVLKAVNTVQIEVDKKLSNFHLILGKVVDLGDALGSAGEKAKPAFDRLEQLANTIRGQRKQSLAIEKQSDPLQIEDKSNEDAS